MAHVAKYQMSAVGALAAHFQRKEDMNGEYVCFKNRDIDGNRTHLNYNLAPVREKGQIAFVKQRLSEVEHVKRSNINVMCAWVLTLPKGFPEEQRFFEEAYNFMAERYGEENVISAYVHKDEAQPHIHFAFVPVKDNRLAASKVIDLQELQSFHPELKAHLEEKLEREVAVLNGATAGGNRTVAEMKAERDTLKAQEVSKKAEFFIKETGEQMKSLTEKKKELELELASLQQKVLTKKEVLEIKASKGILGSLKGITFEEYQALSNTAEYVEEVEAENELLREQIKEANEKTAEAELKAKQALNEKPSIALMTEAAVVKSKLANMENRLFLLADRIPERYKRAVENILDDRHPFHYRTPQRTVQKEVPVLD
ncbi:MAG: plasmid recombination protein [Oscillospiraceae bacterium]|nr:plasmid recombination protein [Oscillospiraceae bacterium]